MKLHITESFLVMLALLPFAGMALETETVAPTPHPPAFTLPPLPYALDALAPYISAQTMGFHYGKHHQGYVTKLNTLVADTPLAALPLDEIVRQTAGVAGQEAVFNNAAQTWNHSFFWLSMKPGGGGQPTEPLLARIDRSFGSFQAFKADFVAAAGAQFGSGWVWLVQEGDTLKIVKTANADTPLVHGQTALLTCDVWEHAYYLDYQNRRTDFVALFLDHLANWDFAAGLLK